MKRSKNWRKASELVDENKGYSPLEAAKLAKETSTVKFDATVVVAIGLGVDPKKADQAVRGTVNLPHGTGKTARVIVFAAGEKAEEARQAGADEVGSDDLIEKVSGGYTNYDAVVSTPDLMGKVGRLGKVLGPRGLMPNPKTGTVSVDIGKAIKDIKAGKVEFRLDKEANVAVSIGRVSFTEQQLAENLQALTEAIVKSRPASVKGNFFKAASIHTTMGPGIKFTFEGR